MPVDNLTVIPVIILINEKNSKNEIKDGQFGITDIQSYINTANKRSLWEDSPHQQQKSINILSVPNTTALSPHEFPPALLQHL